MIKDLLQSKHSLPALILLGVGGLLSIALPLDSWAAGLVETMVGAYQQIRDLWKRDPRTKDLRTAAFLNAINKIAQSYLELGVFP